MLPGAISLQPEQEQIRYKGIDANISKIRLELSSEWGKFNGFIWWRLTDSQSRSYDV